MSVSVRPPMLDPGYMALAIKLQEAGSDLTNSDVMARLRDAVNDKYRGNNSYSYGSYVMDYIGDAESGDVIYSCNGETYKAPYEITGGGAAAAKCVIIFDRAVDVVPRTIYEEEADEADHYAAMESSYKTDNLYTSLPLYERFISKSERGTAAEDDFAGKGKSYPILKAEDVSAAAHALGRAGTGNLSTNTIKARIIAIAKRKGWSKFLPKAWQGGGDVPTTKGKEADVTVQSTDLKLVESAGPAFLEDIHVSEAARANYPVKLISPGTGTMAHYPESVLERDGPKVFKKGLLMYWNHATAAEESARPEGDLDNLAAILTKDAWYDKNGAKGPGLYSEAKVMADYAQKVEERAPFIGLSIRAGGKGTGKLVNGKPELASIEYAESVDYVTKAGRGGIALAEAARDAGLLPPVNEPEPAKEIAHVKVTEAMKSCSDCAGGGDCAGCKGTGKIAKKMAESAGRKMSDCPDCKGSGDCATCAGKGKVAMEESARDAKQGDDMDEKAVQALIESAMAPLQTKLTEAGVTNANLLSRALRGDAREIAVDVLKGITLPQAAKDRVITECLKDIPVLDGEVDKVKLTESVNAAAKAEGTYLGQLRESSGMGLVRGMGGSPTTAPVIDAAEAARIAAEDKVLQESAVDIFAALMGDDSEDHAAAKAAVNKGGRAA